MNYRYYTDMAFGSIQETDDPVDNEEVFATFVQARTMLVADLKSRALDYDNAAQDARNLRLSDVERMKQ